MNDFLPFRADWKGAVGFVLAVVVAIAIAKKIPTVRNYV